MKLDRENSKKNRSVKYLKLDNKQLVKIKLSRGVLFASATLISLGIITAFTVFCNNLLSKGDLDVASTITALMSIPINTLILERLGVNIWNKSNLIRQFDKLESLEEQSEELEKILNNNKNESIVYYPHR